jgi:hypothetical protein
MPAVFLSYRRGDSSGYAVGMKNDLRGRGLEVFMDLDAIGLGKRYPKVIEEALRSSDALVALIGRGWLTAEDEDGRRRLDDGRDFVRREIAAALERDILVVPTLVDGATMPTEEELPPDLTDLATRQALKLDNEHWDQDVQRLVDAIAADRTEKVPPSGPETPLELPKQPPGGRGGVQGGFVLGRRAWLVLGALVAAAAIAIAAVVLTRGGGDGSPVDEAEIERVALPRLGAGGRDVPRGVASDGDALLVAVGAAVRGDGADAPRSARAWRSEDGGATWGVAEVQGSGEAPREEMRGVARVSGAGFLALGQQDGDVNVWRSTDGVTWLPHSRLRRAGEQFVHGVLARPGLVVAVGSENVAVGEGRDAAGWWSADDGMTWNPAALKGFAGKENQEIKGVAEGRNGVLVAVGYDGNIGEAAVWFSRDAGATWDRVRIDGGQDTEQMAAVTAVSSGLVAVGREGESENADAAVWKSVNNGRKWLRITPSAFDVRGEQVLTGVVATPAELFAVGSEKLGAGRRTAAIWRSDDEGESWTRLSGSALDGDDGAGSITTALALGDVLVGLGDSTDAAAAWMTEAS